MPVGRIYQAPALTVSRNTPVYGYNGIKSGVVRATGGSDLVVTGQSYHSSRKSKSPSPSNTMLINNNNNNVNSINNNINNNNGISSRNGSRHLHKSQGATSSAANGRNKKDSSGGRKANAASGPKGIGRHVSPAAQPPSRNCSTDRYGGNNSRGCSPAANLPCHQVGGSPAGSLRGTAQQHRRGSYREASWSPEPQQTSSDNRNYSIRAAGSRSPSIMDNNNAAAVVIRKTPPPLSSESSSGSKDSMDPNRNSCYSVSGEGSRPSHQTYYRQHGEEDEDDMDGLSEDESGIDTGMELNMSRLAVNTGNGTRQKQNGHSSDTVDSPDSGCQTSQQTTGTNGLRNIGNTCFMNSVIQCLSNTKQLCEYLISDDYVRDINSSSAMKGSLIKAFATVIKNLWKGSGKVVDPSSFKGALQRFAPRFSGYNQEDSQEFLRYLLEGLHEDVNRITTKPTPIHTEIDSSLSVNEQAMEAWKRYIRRDDSRLVDLFVGQLKSTLRCTICDYESVTFEPFWDLSLPIPSRTGDVSLNECFEAFTKEEVLDGEEMPTCEHCRTRRKCIKFYSLYKLPQILVVHLKRFSPTERFRSKLSSTVNFPLNGFDLSKFSDAHCRTTYSCYAVSNHSGTLYSGHYTAYARHHKTGQWYFFNDSRVSKCSSSSVISNEAYLLFFELS